MGMVKEFKDFAMRGNVVDLAVGVVIGGAFGKIVTSLVNDIIMPPLNLLTAKLGLEFNKLSLKYSALFGKDGLPKDNPDGPVLLNYGAFLQAMLDFVIIAFAIFMAVKLMNSLKKKEEAAPSPPPAEDVLLLREIRDSLVRNSPRKVD